MTYLSDILKFYLSPRTVKIESGTITSEEGSEIGPGDIVTVYAGGIKLYVSPEQISMLKGEEKRGYFRSSSIEYGQIFTGDRIAKSLFISNKEELLDQHCQKKVYTNVSDILAEKPPFAVANDDFMAFSANENQGMRKVKNGDKLELIFDERSTRTEGVVLKAIIETDIVILHENSKLNVTGCFDNNTLYNTNSIVEGTVPLPRVMSFANEDTHELFRSQTGFGRLVINKTFKCAMCLATKLGKAIDRVSRDFGVIKRVRCFDVDMDEIKAVKVQIVKDSAMENVKIKFAKEAGIDNNGFKFYDLYLQVKGEIERDDCYAEMRPTPPSEDPPSDSDSDTGSYEVPCDKRKEAKPKAPPPPRSPRSDHTRKLSSKMRNNDADRISPYPSDFGPNFIRSPSTKSMEISEQLSTQRQIHQRPVFNYEPNTILQMSSQYESTERARPSTLLEKPSLQVEPVKSPKFAPEMFPVSKLGITLLDLLDKQVPVMEDQERHIELDIPDKFDDIGIDSGDDCYEEMRLIPQREDPPSDSDSDTGSYEEPCDKRKEAEPKAPPPPPRSPRSDHTRKLSSKMRNNDADRISPYPDCSGQNFIRSPSTKSMEISEQLSTQRQIHERPVFNYEPNTIIQRSSQYESTERARPSTLLEKPSLQVEPVKSPKFAPEMFPVSKLGNTPLDLLDKQVPVIEDQERPTEPYFPDTLDDTDTGSGCNDGASNIAFSDLSVSQLADILNGQNLEKLAKMCEKNKIDGKFLLTFSDDDLKTDPINLNWLEIKKLSWLKDGNKPKV